MLPLIPALFFPEFFVERIFHASHDALSQQQLGGLWSNFDSSNDPYKVSLTGVYARRKWQQKIFAFLRR